MIELNSRDWLTNIWLPKGMHLDTQWYKIQNMKNLPQRYKSTALTTLLSLFKLAKCCNICPLVLKNLNEIMFLSDSLPVNRN